MNNFDQLPDDVNAYCLNFLSPSERLTSASVSKRFHSNAVYSNSACGYWLLLGAHSYNDFKGRAGGLKDIHVKLFNALLCSPRFNTQGKLPNLETIGKIYLSNKREETLSFLLGEKSTLSF